MERVRGIEPPLSAWKAGALPLNYTRINQVDNINYSLLYLFLQLFFAI